MINVEKIVNIYNFFNGLEYVDDVILKAEKNNKKALFVVLVKGKYDDNIMDELLDKELEFIEKNNDINLNFIFLFLEADLDLNKLYIDLSKMKIDEFVG